MRKLCPQASMTIPSITWRESPCTSPHDFSFYARAVRRSLPRLPHAYSILRLRRDAAKIATARPLFLVAGAAVHSIDNSERRWRQSDNDNARARYNGRRLYTPHTFSVSCVHSCQRHRFLFRFSFVFYRVCAGNWRSVRNTEKNDLINDFIMPVINRIVIKWNYFWKNSDKLNRYKSLFTL